MAGELLQFQALQSFVDVEFWFELGKHKLNDLRLSEEALPLRGILSSSSNPQLPAPLQLERQSFEIEASSRPGSWSVPGELHNVNTLERFKTYDRAQLLQETAAVIWNDILTGAAERDPSLLGRFAMISYADLKSFRMYYWFCFPALKHPEPIKVTEPPLALDVALGPDTAKEVLRACEEWREGRALEPREDGPSEASAPVWLIVRVESPEGTSTQARPLQDWAQAATMGEVLVAVADTAGGAPYPGWLLRNVLLMVAMQWGWPEVRVVLVRGRPGRATADTTLLLTAQLPLMPPDWGSGEATPAAVGWEANAKGKTGPRMVDLGPSMDPRRLAESAVDLNLRLMRWRAAPGLDTDRLAATRCLLLGAGTLGCAVARTLLGWGVRTITLLDYGRVAFSNPVRQSLYEFADCLDGGKPKAQAAAEALEQIFPSVNARGIEMAIPMPGHPLPTPEEVTKAEEAYNQLSQLIDEHDVVFLLMDTRESRWLPTLLAAAAGKLAINAALGFDSFLVMRHGAAPSPGDEKDAAADGGASHRLGCYFCNDVVAPLDSTVDRTLDQMCTVARPGLAPIAGALAVEVMAATLTHPEGVNAPAPVAESSGTSGTEGLPLGPAPHMIRGQLSGGFTQRNFTGHAFRQCTACSGAVVSRLKEKGWPFVLDALQDPKSLEDLTGLTELHASANAMMEGFDDDDEDDDSEM